uniref:Uncharacterized protein n=1 Tax=Zea mays TaxID=4577 RepID=A0A804NEJ0_MAIZE
MWSPIVDAARGSGAPAGGEVLAEDPHAFLACRGPRDSERGLERAQGLGSLADGHGGAELEDAALAREEDDGAEPRGLGEGRPDVPPGRGVDGGPGVAGRGERVARPARALREGEVHGRQKVHLGGGDPVEAERVVGPLVVPAAVERVQPQQRALPRHAPVRVVVVRGAAVAAVAVAPAEHGAAAGAGLLPEDAVRPRPAPLHEVLQARLELGGRRRGRVLVRRRGAQVVRRVPPQHRREQRGVRLRPRHALLSRPLLRCACGGSSVSVPTVHRENACVSVTWRSGVFCWLGSAARAFYTRSSGELRITGAGRE